MKDPWPTPKFYITESWLKMFGLVSLLCVVSVLWANAEYKYYQLVNHDERFDGAICKMVARVDSISKFIGLPPVSYYEEP